MSLEMTQLKHEVNSLNTKVEVIDIKLNIIMIALGIDVKNHDTRPPAGSFNTVKKMVS